MQASEFKRLAEGLLEAVLAAGRVQMGYFRRGVAVMRKSDDSPVTVADQESERLLLAALDRVAPGVPVIAEEAVTAGRIPAIGRRFFLVDPLDGTKGFVRGDRDFTINIGLIEDRVPTFGVVYAPALDDFYVTLAPAETANARLAPDAPVRTLADCALQPVRTRVPQPGKMKALTSTSHPRHETVRLLDRYGVTERKPVSSSIKFCLIARGEADVYPRMGPTSEWDTAAGQAVLTAAGGVVTRFDGAPMVYGNAADKFVNPAFVAWGRPPAPQPE